MRRLPIAFTAGVLVVGTTVYVGLSLQSRPGRTTAAVKGVALPASPLKRADADFASKPKKAADAYKEFVRSNAASKDPGVQDRVGEARLKLAYIDARDKNFAQARAELLTASREYRGTGKMSADFGGIPDQAAYQAAVCLVAEGKKTEAAHEFREFMKDRPLSPLVYAARRRLDRMKVADPNADDAALQKDVALQEAHVRFETSVCGPKCLAYVLPKLGKQGHSYQELAKLSGTTDKGTTLQGLRGALHQLGVESYGFQLDAKDFATMPLPALLAQDDHFVAVVKFDTDHMLVFDPILNAEQRIPLPKATDTKFSANVLLFELPKIGA